MIALISRSIRNWIIEGGMKGSNRSISTQLVEKAEGKSPFLLVASIGNPEKGFKGTRHSVGHYVLKQVAEKWSFTEKNTRIGSLNGFVTSPYRDDILFFESDSFMNLSGKPIKQAWQSVINSLKVQQYTPVLVVLHDELDLPLGKVKVRKQLSSHKGHNGLKSIQAQLGGGFGYIAVSIGISRPESRSPNVVADYVLGKFSSSETQTLDSQVVPRVEQIIDLMLTQEKHIYDVNENHKSRAKI